VSTIPGYLQSLVDDAAIFPPGDAPLPQAVKAHREYRAAAFRDLVGPLVVSDLRLPELLELLREAAPADEPSALPVAVVVSGGAGAIEPAVRWATGSGLLELRGVEVALRDEEDLAHNARRVVTMVDQLAASGELDETTTVSVEPPRVPDGAPSPPWLSALDEIAAADHRLKLRTGGVTGDTFPGPAELAGYIEAALDRELRFKCTAGLHHALRHRDQETGFEHHGFLNVLLATRACLDGLPSDDAAARLEERDPDAVVAMLDEAGPDALLSARRWFTSIGSCSVLEPLEDLVDLDLLPDLSQESA
jgi:hypothetical protein